jgi:hypothetical protein
MAQERKNYTGPHLGTWKLQSFTTEDLATGQKTDLFGAHPGGFLSYGPDGRMYAILLKEGRPQPTSFQPTRNASISTAGLAHMRGPTA